MHTDTPDRRAKKVAQAAQNYAQAIGKDRPLKTLRDELLLAVGELIGQEVLPCEHAK